MKFLFTAPRYHTNQVPTVRGLKKRGHIVKYFVSFVGEVEDHTDCDVVIIKPSGGTLNDIDSIQGSHFVPDAKDLKRKFIAYGPEVVICREKTPFTLAVYELCLHSNIPCLLYDQEPLYKMTAASCLTKKNKISPGKRIVNKIMTYLNKDKRNYIYRKKKYGFPLVHITPVLTDSYSQYITSDYNLEAKGHSYYFPLVYESSLGKEENRHIELNKINILCVGKYRPYKYQKILIDALSKMAETKGIYVRLVGQCCSKDEEEYFKNLQRYVHSLGLDDVCELRKNISYYEMQKLYSDYDILVLPSEHETYGMVIIEAMAHGLCVIASECCGASFCIEMSQAGKVFPVGDSDRLAEIIQYYVSHPEEILKCGLRGRRYVEEYLTINNYIDILSDILIKEFDLTLIPENEGE